MYRKDVMNAQSCCFANLTYCFFAVLVDVTVIVALAPFTTKEDWGERIYQSLREASA